MAEPAIRAGQRLTGEPGQRVLSRTLITLLLSFAGGFVFHLAGLPASWIAGGILMVAVTSLAGVSTLIPRPVADATFLFLGIYAGSGVRPETLNQIVTWPASFVLLGITVAAVTMSAYLFLTRLCNWDRETSLLSALPGALSFVVAVAEGTNADLRRVIVAQSVRLFALVQFIPILVYFVGVPDYGAVPWAQAVNYPDLAVLMVAGSVSGYIGKKSGLPAGLLIGGLLSSATLYLTGTIDTAIPQWLIIPGLVGIGAVAGSRFRPGDWSVLKQIIGAAIGAFAVASIVSLVGALSTSYVLGISFAKTFLAFAPGGLDVLTVLAFSLNVDPAYVAAHHLVRFIGLALLVPFVARWLDQHPGKRIGAD